MIFIFIATRGFKNDLSINKPALQAARRPCLHPSLGQGLMWGVNAHERDHIPASYVTLTILSMLVLKIFNGRLLRTSA